MKRLSPGYFRRFLLIAASVIFVAMSALSYAALYTLQSSLTLAAAEEGAALMNLFVGPLVQEFAATNTPSVEHLVKLDELMKTKFGNRTKVLRIWLQDGSLVYSNQTSVAKAIPTARIRQAFQGETGGSLVFSGDPNGSAAVKYPLIRIFAPLYFNGSSEVIAASEIYNDAGRLVSQINGLRAAAVALVTIVSVPMTLILLQMARQANSLVNKRRGNLKRRMVQAQALATQNIRLRRKTEQARVETVISNEQLLAQIGQDLHDGPIQRLSILALKLGDPAITHKTDQRQPNEAAQLLSATLSELRDISAGLILPQLEGLSAEETLWLAVKQHEDATGTTVWCEIGELPLCSEPVRVCLYRVVQEGLNNAYQHANALQQRVIVSADSHAITAVVSDGGPSGITPRSRRAGGGLGLIGLKRRVQAFHGTFAVHSQSDETRVTAKIPIAIASSAKI